MARRRNEPEVWKGEQVQELHRDLTRKYQIHRSKIEEIWRSFDAAQRARVLKAGAAEGRVLKNPTDRSMGNVYKVIPEINLSDIAESGSDYLLDLLKHRASKSLIEQYCEGTNDSPGDYLFILNSMRNNNLRHVEQFKYCFTKFWDESTYGRSYQTTDASTFMEVMADLSLAVDAGLCVPQSTGELILERQLYTLQVLNVLVGDILDNSSTRNTSTRSKKPEEVARAALSKLTLLPKPEKLSLQDLEASALDQRSSLTEYMNLLRTEPVSLTHAVNHWFFSRPELLQDEKGRCLPFHTDRYIGASFLEVTHNAAVGTANWNYIYRLLQLLHDGLDDKGRRSVLLQEMSNVCHLEHGRVQSLFKRHVQTGTGSKYFRRISGVYDNGIPRVAMKVKPETLTRENPQLHYVLRLCQTGTDASKSVEWIKKLDDLHQAYPSERDELEEREFESFSDLAVIASFVHSLSTLLALPSAKLKKRQIYGSRLEELTIELSSLKAEIDLSAFAIPIDNLLEPGMAHGALDALDQFIVEKTGTNFGFLYQDLVENSVLEVLNSCKQKEAKIDEFTKVEVPSPLIEAPIPEVRIQQRRQKDKTRQTRPAHSSIYDLISPEPTAQIDMAERVEPTPVFKVKQATFEVFSTLFSKSQSRGSITWVAFEAAMADLRFSIMPKTGSVFTLFPPEDMGVEKSVTLHRPHQSRIEGHKLLVFAARLHRVYGWDEQSFEVA